jgi:hypothetical protein
VRGGLKTAVRTPQRPVDIGRRALKLGMDGFFTDHPHPGRLARDAFVL